MLYKFQNNTLPQPIKLLFRSTPNVLHRYPTSYSNRNFVLTEYSAPSEKTKNVVSYNLPKIVNSMPSHIIAKTRTHSIQSFKDHVKRYYLDNYSSQVNHGSNCYVCNLLGNF